MDDIILFSTKKRELQLMIKDLDHNSKITGLTMNPSKTKLMINSTGDDILLDNASIEYVKEYTYLGQTVTFHRLDKEISIRINGAWKKY